MKSLLTSIFLIGTTLTFWAQVPESALSLEDPAFGNYVFNPGNIPVVKGKVLNLTEEEKKDIKINYSVVTPLSQLQDQKSTQFQEDGSFKLELDYAFPFQQIWLRIGELFYAGIYAREELYLELDADLIRGKEAQWNGEGISYQGKDGALNEYLNDFILYRREDQLELSKAIQLTRKTNNISAEQFLQKYDSIFQGIKLIVNEYTGKYPSKYAWILENEYLSKYYGWLCINFSMTDAEIPDDLWDEIVNHTPYLVSNDGMSYYKYLSLFFQVKTQNNLLSNLDFNTLRGYSEIDPSGYLLIDSLVYFQRLIDKVEPYDTLRYKSLRSSAMTYFADTINIIKNQNILDRMDQTPPASKADILKLKFSDVDLERKKMKYQMAIESMETEWTRKMLGEQYQKILNRLSNINEILENTKPLDTELSLGEPLEEMSCGAQLYQVKDINAAQFLANLKSAFKGTAMIIDFWATWCGPCAYQMPYSQKLHEEVKDMPVEFIYLCSSERSSLETWKKAVARHQLSGIHIYVDQPVMDELMNMFSFRGFPSYAFFSTAGEYKPGVISRPSVMSREDLEKLLEP